MTNWVKNKNRTYFNQADFYFKLPVHISLACMKTCRGLPVLEMHHKEKCLNMYALNLFLTGA